MFAQYDALLHTKYRNLEDNAVLSAPLLRRHHHCYILRMLGRQYIIFVVLFMTYGKQLFQHTPFQTDVQT